MGQPVAASGPSAARAAYERAGVLLELRRPAEAARLLRDALAAGADDPDLYGQLARALIALGEPDEALAAATELRRLEPAAEWGHRLASMAYGRLDRRQDAIQAAAEAVRLAPQRWQPHVQLAEAYLANTEWDRANAAALYAVQLAPEEPGTHWVVGSIALRQRVWSRAEAAYRRVLELDPDDALARNNLALVTLRRGKLARAASGFADAVSTDPRRDLPRRNLEVTLAAALLWLSLLQEAPVAAGWGALRSAVSPPAAGWFVAAALLVLLGGAGWRWWSLPRTVRRYAAALLRTDRGLRLPVSMLLTGFGVLLAATAVLFTGHPLPGRVLIVAGGLCTLVAIAAAKRYGQQLTARG
jgi:tetratricopeptide (TPR) repeat protein